MIVLSLDTALAACSVAVTRDGDVLAALSEPMHRGHQERLAPMVEEAMRAAGLPFTAIDRIGVTVGPGSFTGLRVGLAFAKGLGLALDRPCVGICTLEALAASDPGPGLTVAVIDARRGQLYLQAFESGAAVMAPDALPIEVAVARLAELWRGGPLRLNGPGAVLLAASAPGAEIVERTAPDPAAICALAVRKAASTGARPLYLRAPDAKLPGGKDLAP